MPALHATQQQFMLFYGYKRTKAFGGLLEAPVIRSARSPPPSPASPLTQGSPQKMHFLCLPFSGQSAEDTHPLLVIVLVHCAGAPVPPELHVEP
eukprot:scaffold20608_cov19-Tisochrysis_lutea.AAC.2